MNREEIERAIKAIDQFAAMRQLTPDEQQYRELHRLALAGLDSQERVRELESAVYKFREAFLFLSNERRPATIVQRSLRHAEEARAVLDKEGKG